MSDENQVLAIDAGNTSIKVGLFSNDELVEVRRFTITKLEELKTWLVTLDQSSSVLSSVLSTSDTKLVLALLVNPLIVDHQTKFPIELDYATPDTLGIDRICNAVYANKNSTSEYAVTIDIGTCIKFDLTNNGKYVGGSIAPGIELRYKSLNDYTGNLPLLSNKTVENLVGNSTNTSIQAGVMNGIQAELQEMVQQYRSQFKDLTFFMTGGDASSFDIHSKNDIFADENLTLKGLYEIHKHNA
ncbi:MAG: type III pantothenate kinase [Crocinitomicaceae bacterium]|nr:type III pantothenate kinase [Crocinitomicaceae bacterium]